MRPKDLFLEAAKELGPTTQTTADRERLESLKKELQERAGTIFDFVFSNVGSNAKERFFNGYSWSTGFDIKYKKEWDENYQVEVTRRWFGLDAPARAEFDALAPKDSQIFKRLLVGAHDLRVTTDGGNNWGDRLPAASLDVVTSLFTVSNKHIPPVEEIDDPFSGFSIVERLNDWHRVFGNNIEEQPGEILDDGVSVLAKPTYYGDSYKLIGALHSSLDDVENAIKYPFVPTANTRFPHY